MRGSIRLFGGFFSLLISTGGKPHGQEIKAFCDSTPVYLPFGSNPGLIYLFSCQTSGAASQNRNRLDKLRVLGLRGVVNNVVDGDTIRVDVNAIWGK
jgi:hypothetical protein